MKIPKEIKSQWLTYIDLKEKGLKKQANKALKSVVNIINMYDVGYFNDFLYSLCKLELNKGINNQLQYPIFVKCILPILVEGVRNNSVKDIVYLVQASESGFSREIYKELGDISNRDLLRTALISEPDNTTVKSLLGANYVYDLYYGAHHLPDSMIGDIAYVTSLINESSDFFDANSQVLHKDLINEHSYYCQLYRDYIMWESGCFDFDFSTWCEKHNRKYSWVKSYYYE